jgi:hypothetical protein
MTARMIHRDRSSPEHPRRGVARSVASGPSGSNRRRGGQEHGCDRIAPIPVESGSHWRSCIEHLFATARAAPIPRSDRLGLARTGPGLAGAYLPQLRVTCDQPGLCTYGRLLVDWNASGFTDGRAFEFANLRYYGGAFDIVATLLEPLAPFSTYATRHLLGSLRDRRAGVDLAACPTARWSPHRSNRAGPARQPARLVGPHVLQFQGPVIRCRHARGRCRLDSGV